MENETTVVQMSYHRKRICTFSFDECANELKVFCTSHKIPIAAYTSLLATLVSAKSRYELRDIPLKSCSYEIDPDHHLCMNIAISTKISECGPKTHYVVTVSIVSKAELDLSAIG